MSYLVDSYHGETAAAAPVSERVAFIRRTYAHVLGAILAFVGLSAGLIATGMAEQILRDIFLASRMSWLLLMVVFIGGTFAAQYMAQARRSVGMQYAGLALYVMLYTLLFCAAMVALAAGFIIYDTSNIIHHYGTNEHVAASLELFASVALLFWYILRIFYISRND